MPSDYAKTHGFSFDDYKVVYEGDIVPNEDGPIATLDDIFTIFNIRRPEDFKGHSLSVSDLVELDGVCYYCDSCGWEDM